MKKKADQFILAAPFILFKNLSIQKILFWFIAFLAFTFVLSLTLWQGRYVTDPHHWGLMLSNVTDLKAGRIPYKEIFIQYGILTTIIHTSAFLIANNLLSIVMVTGLCYGLGIVLLSRLVYRLSLNTYHAIAAMIICILLHPLAIYPWSNYVAFPFIVLGLYGLLFDLQKKCAVIFSGLALGLSALARENLFLPLLLMILITAVIDFLNYKNISRKLILYIFSFLSPIAFFLIYLYFNNLLKFWYISSFLLPKYYISEIFPSINSWRIFNSFINTFISGLVRFDPRWYLLTLIFIYNIAIIIKNIIRYNLNDVPYIKIAIFSLILCAGAIHLTEVFRLSTGFIIGLISVSYFTSKFRFVKYIIFVIALFSMPTTIYGNSGNYYLPTISQKNENITVKNGYFKYQKWPLSVINYYSSIYDDLAKIQEFECGIKFHYNSTSDNFIKVLSPFAQFQFLPMGDGPFEGHRFESGLSSLRPDIDYLKKISEHKDIIIFKNVNKHTQLSKYVDEGFFIYKKYVTPNMLFVKSDSILLILIPQGCV